MGTISLHGSVPFHLTRVSLIQSLMLFYGDRFIAKKWTVSAHYFSTLCLILFCLIVIDGLDGRTLIPPRTRSMFNSE
jgi:hypothetical protein